MDADRANRKGVTSRAWKTGARIPFGVFSVAAALFGSGCSSSAPPADGVASTGDAIDSSTVVGDWSLLGNGQCLAAMQSFYPSKFGVRVPVARNAWTGSCGHEGACHVWLDDIPDGATWERIPNDGSQQPSTYDLIVFAPTAHNPYGHIASVDHVGSDGAVYVMDSNWHGDERRSLQPHTAYASYGWYHLRSLPKNGGGGGGGFAWSCGQSAYGGQQLWTCSNGDLYRCDVRGAPQKASCAAGCMTNPAGTNDVCRGAARPSRSTCGTYANASGYGPRVACEWNGNGACAGRGPTTLDCDHCCDVDQLGGEAASASVSCGDWARSAGYARAACEWNGNGACGGIGASTSDCEHCCDVGN